MQELNLILNQMSSSINPAMIVAILFGTAIVAFLSNKVS